MSNNFNLKEQILELNRSINYYEKKINSCKEKVKKFEYICKKYPDIEYYGGKIFYLPEPSLAKKITFVAGYLNNIDSRTNYRSPTIKNNKYTNNKMLYSYFLDGDLKIVCDKNVIFIESGVYGYSGTNQTIEVKDYSTFFDKSDCKDKLVKSTKKLLMKYLVNLSNHNNITITDNSFDKDKIKGMLLFK
jgi:hypothetical protein